MKRYLLAALALAALSWGLRAGCHTYEAQVHRLDLKLRAESVSEWNGRYYEKHELTLASARSIVPRSLPRRASVAEHFDDPIEPVVDFARRLEERGVELWVLPVPPRPIINASNLRGWGGWGPDSSVYTKPWKGYLEALKGRGITVIDVLPTLQAGASEDQDKWIHNADHHWSNPAMIASAQLVAARLAEQGLTDGAAEIDTVPTWKEISKGPTGSYKKVVKTKERVRYRRIDDARGGRVTTSHPDSPILVFGDSHVGWYGKWHADFVRQLIHETGVEVDALEVHSGAATRSREELARRDWNDPGYIERKRVAIWVFFGTSVQTQEWRIVPLERFPGAKLHSHMRLLHLATDRVLVERGKAVAGIGHNWRTPRDTKRGDDTLWLSAQNRGELTFTSPAGGEIILELAARHGLQQVKVSLDGIPLHTLKLSDKRVTRHRLPIPEGIDGQKALHFQVMPNGEDSGRDRIGVRNATWIAPRRRTWTSPRRAEWEPGLSLEHTVENTKAVRFWVRSRKDTGTLSLHQDGRLLAEMPVRPDWTEHAVQLRPAGEEDPVLRWSMDDTIFELAWLEMDQIDTPLF